MEKILNTIKSYSAKIEDQHFYQNLCYITIEKSYMIHTSAINKYEVFIGEQ